jgi:hypothetical protein
MAGTFLKRTMDGAESSQKGTISFWIKRSQLGTEQTIFSNGSYASGWSTYGQIRFRNPDDLEIRTVSSGVEKNVRITSRKFRDINSWYHIVISFDFDSSTADNYIQLYVNGVKDSEFAQYGNLSGQTNMFFVGSDLNGQRIGNFNTGEYFDGSISHFHCIVGTVYDASAFGSTDATTGEWKINTAPSVTYGDGGFFILKDGNSVTDQSGNGNNWVVDGDILSKTEDCPSNVFATWNPFTCRPDYVFSNQFGNTRWRHSEANSHHSVRSTLGFNSGKYYAEFKVVSNVSNSSMQIGISSLNTANTPDTAVFGLEGSGYQNNGVLYRNGYSDVTGLTTFAQNDIIGVACDFDNKMIYWYKNGTLLNGTGYAFSLNGGIAEDDFYGFACSGYQTSGDDVVIDANFGNGYFNNTAVSSAGTNASGNGIFEYDVPTGYTALSTKGLNL